MGGSVVSGAMDVFSLRDDVIGAYKRFATSFTTIRAPDIRAQVEKTYATDRYWPEPLLQINPNYQRTTDVAALVKDGSLEPMMAEIFRQPASGENPKGPPLKLYTHQEQAIALAAHGASYVVTTGTGSGKSLCFFIPIVNAVLAEKKKDPKPRTRAIIIYPMNALANSQLEELEKFVGNVAPAKPVTVKRYTGQESDEERKAVAEDPPDILLTNFVMLELLMTRQDQTDRRVMENCAGLRFLVLDELHTYRGRQGADVALLVRRVRERLSPEKLQCIGTSATMASEGLLSDKNAVVAAVASKLFSVPVPASNVVVETLERITDKDLNEENVRPQLAPAIAAGVAPTITDQELRTHPLAIWAETRLGVEFSQNDHRWVRARPLTVNEAVTALASASGAPEADCRRALLDLLLRASVPETERTQAPSANTSSFFAFKLHQFVSGAGHAFCTLDDPGKRTVTVEGQQFLPGDASKRLYPVHFCRDCGQEVHPVRLVAKDGAKRLLARDIDDAVATPADEDADGDAEAETADQDGEVFGFVTPDSEDLDFDDDINDYPESWLETDKHGQPRLKVYYRSVRPVELFADPSGEVGSGRRFWFTPGKFRICLHCKQTFGTSARDRNRLASLSAEGRSSATTVLVSTVLRWMHREDSGLQLDKRKLLGFTDNRQDAALQAGHFNDFLFVSLIRAGFLGALDAAGTAGLRAEVLGSAQQQALGFHVADPRVRAEWLSEPQLKGVPLLDAETTLRQVLSYRVWFDQRRGWRYTNPNLEQLGLVDVEYIQLREFCEDESEFAGAPPAIKLASPQVRETVYRAIFDHLRKWMAVRSQVLEQTAVEGMLSRSHSRLRPPWGFGYDEKPRRARWLLIVAPSSKTTHARDEDLMVRGGSRSALGRLLRKTEIWGGSAEVRDMKSAEFDALMASMLQIAAAHYGFVTETPTPFGETVGWQLNDACVLFKKGDGRTENARRPENAFFSDLYANLAAMLRHPANPLFGFEAREHTAQVDMERRAVRERRFRYGAKEVQDLAAQEKQLRDIGESRRFLPVLFCSPTMELGVDISALNAVYLRNVPPTPANYAQRSGRAGRSGQAAFVLTYCSAQGPHDQYFFRDQRGMVNGVVRPPVLDLANRDLIESHLSAVWLAATETPLNASISELLVLRDPARPVKQDIKDDMSKPAIGVEATKRIAGVLDLLAGDLKPEYAPWFQGRDHFAASVAATALDRFERAFNRWRELFAAAESQRDAARRTMDNYAAPQAERRAAERRHQQAIEQLNLLQKGDSTQSSDFYTYRYLATEGFLPGYNFPRLPLMAFIPATSDGKGKGAFLQRPRFLALSEFGPRSLVYHEGRAFRVDRALLPLSSQSSGAVNVLLPVRAARICTTCGAAHMTDAMSMCHSCGRALGSAEIVRDIYRIENVATKPVERITANDEERQRQGFDVQTVYEWATRDHDLDVRRAAAQDEAGDVVKLVYGSGATITRLNKGLRRRRNRTTLGFMVDPVSGYWAKSEDESDDTPDPTANPRQRIVPSVEDRKNALHVQIPVNTEEEALTRETVATVQHALLRGIATVFQLEEGELLAEPMPLRASRTGFLFYEASEGGAGVLSRLVAEPDKLAEVARKALHVMHFDVMAPSELPATRGGLVELPGTSCVAACYRCLMSYYNQPDHELIDRRDVVAQAVLVRLAHSKTVSTAAIATTGVPVAAEGPFSAWHAAAKARGVPAPDEKGFAVGESTVPLVWRTQYVAAFLGTPSEAVRLACADKGIELVIFAEDLGDADASFSHLLKLLGRGA